MGNLFSKLLCLLVIFSFSMGNLAEMKSVSEHHNSDEVAQSALNTMPDTTDEDCSDCHDSHCVHHCNGLHVVTLPSAINHKKIPILSLVNLQLRQQASKLSLAVLIEPPQFFQS